MANGLAQALQGNYSSLTRTGFILDENTKSIIENGTEMERVAAITQVLDSTYKDFNKTAAETAEGKMITLKRNLWDIQETIATWFLPVVEKLTDKISDFVEKVANWTAEHPQLTTAIVTVTLAIAGILVVLTTLGVILPILSTGFTVVATAVGILSAAFAFLAANPIVLIIAWIIAAVVALWYAFYQLYKNWDEVSNWISEKWEALKTVFSIWIDTIKGWWDSFYSWLPEPVQEYLDKVIDVWNKFWDLVKTIFNVQIDFIKWIWQGFKALFSGDWEGACNIWAKTWENLWDGVKNILKKSLDLIVSVVDAGLATLKGVWDLAWEWIKSALEAVWWGIKTSISDAWNGIIEWFWGAKDTMVNAIVEPFEKAKEKVLAVWNWIQDKMDAIKGWFGSEEASGVSWGRASWWIVSAGTPYIVGERGQELFVPNTAGRIIPNNQLWGHNITVNVTGNQIRSEHEANALADAVINKLNFQMKMAGFGI